MRILKAFFPRNPSKSRSNIDQIARKSELRPNSVNMGGGGDPLLKSIKRSDLQSSAPDSGYVRPLNIQNMAFTPINHVCDENQ